MPGYRIPKGPIPHGTHNGYNNYRCRCYSCRAANTIACNAARRTRIERGVCIECGDVALNGTRCEKHRAAVNEGRHKCECDHRRTHHKPACSKCGCSEFKKAIPKRRGHKPRVSLLHPLSPEQQKRISELNRVRKEGIRNRWLARYPGIDPQVAMKIYREGYQAGHQRGRTKQLAKLVMEAEHVSAVEERH